MKRGRQLADLLEGSRRLVLLGVGLALVQSALLIPIAVLIQHAFDTSIPQDESTQLVLIGAAILVLFMASAAFGLLTRRLAVKATKTAITALRGKLLQKVFALPRSYFDRTDLGTLHSIIVADSERVDAMTNAIVTLVLPGLTIALVLTATLFFFDPLLAAVLLCSIPLMAILSRWISLKLRGRTREWHQAFDVFSSGTHATLRAVTLTKLLVAERAELERRTRQVSDLSEAGWRMAWLEAAYPQVNNVIGALAAVIVLVVGGLSVTGGRLTVGDLISFYAVLGLLRAQMGNVVIGLPRLTAGGESLDRLEAILSEPQGEPYTGTDPLQFEGAVELRDVSFAYGDVAVLRGVSLRIGRGERVALVGPNGAGKSTVLSLVAGLYGPQGGEILVDDKPLAEVDLAHYRRRIGVVLQDSLILPGTIGDNIAYGRPHATGAEIEAAARRAGADRFIAALPDGFDTDVGDDGNLLSGGQRQRIAIARALLEEPALLMLDEPSTYLDDRIPDELIPAGGDGDGPSILIVSHDPAVYSLADRVYELRDGRAYERPPAAPTQPIALTASSSAGRTA